MFAKIRKWIATYRAAKAARREAYIIDEWNKKSDADIEVAWNDAQDWLRLEHGTAGKLGFRLPESLKTSLEHRLHNYIIPQMVKRGLTFNSSD